MDLRYVKVELKGFGLCLDGDGGVRCEGGRSIRLTPRFLV